MHEMAFIVDIVDTVCESAKKAEATAVKQITLSIGEMRDFHQDYIEAYFEHFSRDTLAQGAEIVVNFIPATTRCPDCGTIVPVDLSVLHDQPQCPFHPEALMELVTGMELSVDSIAITKVPNQAKDA